LLRRGKFTRETMAILVMPFRECPCWPCGLAYASQGSKQEHQTRHGVGQMRVMGIDPGLRACGWGVIDVDGPRIRHVANGTCRPTGTAMDVRLLSLYALLTEVLLRYAPDAAAVEQTFVNAGGQSTLKLGQARGIAVLVPAQAGIDVGEYAPNTVKKTVVGVGHADKSQILHMVLMQLPGCAPDSADAADALAIALCHSVHLQTRGRLAAAVARGTETSA